MKQFIVSAAALFIFGASASAFAASPPASGGGGMAESAVATETCIELDAKFEEAAKKHATSSHLAEAKEKAAKGKTACAAGKTADGIADYKEALKLLGE